MKFTRFADVEVRAQSRDAPGRRRWLPAAALLPLLLVAAGCGAGAAAESDAPPKVSEFPVVTQDAALPLESYLLSSGERAELKDLYRELVSRCAHEFGGDPVVVQPGTEKLVADSRMWGGRFGTLTLEHASSLGYHAGPKDPVAPNFSLFANDGEEPLATILYGADRKVIGEDSPGKRPDVPGLPDGGCATQVNKRLGGDPLAAAPEAVEKMRLAAFRDDRTQSAQRKWVACMAQAGFTYKSIDGPADHFSDGLAVSEEELAVATADVTCTKASRWRDISFAIEKAYQERELKEHPEQWASIKEGAESIYENAREAVAAGK